MLMSDQIILLEERKEVTTFILDDGDITETEVVTATGKSPGYDYSAKIHLGDTVTISEKSKIGKECMKLYTGGDGEIPMGIIVNDPVVMSGGIRKASVLMLGQLFRLKLDEESEDNINVNDRLTLTTHNAVLSAQGEYYALHPVTAGEYEFINTFKAGGGGSGEKGDTGDTGPKGDTGDTGPMTIIKGSYDTLEELIAAHPTGQPGDAYIVAGDLYIWEE